MTTLSRTRLVNPRIGSYFAIFASIYLALVLLALIFEELGLSAGLVRLLVLAAPVLIYVAIGVAVPADGVLDFYASGRRVPAMINGAVLAMTAIGGTGFVIIAGLLFMSGVDALALTTGLTAGLVVMAILIAPFFRKFGAFTVPAFLANRLESRKLGVTAALVLVVPVSLMLVAEVKIATSVAGAALGLPPAIIVAMLLICVLAILVPGGLRGITWSATAMTIAALVALAVPLTIISIYVANLPIPQMTQGNLARALARLEDAQGVPLIATPPTLFNFAGQGLEPLGKKYLQFFGDVGAMAYVATVLTTAAGIAAAPWLLARVGASIGVYDARKSMGWAVLIAGFVLLSLPAGAVFLRGMVMEQVAGSAGGPLPVWFQTLQSLGMADIETKSRVVRFGNIVFARDSVYAALPIAAGFPQALVMLTFAGALAAALTTILATLHALSGLLADIVTPGANDIAEKRRLVIVRGFVALTAIAAGALSLVPADPLRLVLAALAISAATAFPTVVLAILWKRITAPAAFATLITGGATAVVLLGVGDLVRATIAPPFAGLIAMLVAFLTAVVVTRISPAPGRHVLEIVRDMRVPGGETIADREARLARLRHRRHV
jgi:cation/acetate symporter